MKRGEADKRMNSDLAVVFSEMVHGAIEKVWRQLGLRNQCVGDTMYFARVNGKDEELSIFFSTPKMFKVGHLIDVKDMEKLKKCWPKEDKIWEMAIPFYLSEEFVTREEFDQVVNKMQKEVDEVKRSRDEYEKQTNELMMVTHTRLMTLITSLGKRVKYLTNRIGEQEREAQPTLPIVKETIVLENPISVIRVVPAPSAAATIDSSVQTEKQQIEAEVLELE